MVTEQIKNIYRVSMGLTLFLFISAILFTVFHIFGFVPKMYVFMFGLILFINLYSYRHILGSDIISNSSMFLIATTLFANAFYILFVSFMSGRYFISHL